MTDETNRGIICLCYASSRAAGSDSAWEMTVLIQTAQMEKLHLPPAQVKTNGKSITMKKSALRCLALFAPVAALFLVTGCGSIAINSNQYLGVPSYPPSNPAQIQILRQEPTRPCVRLGEVRAEPFSEDTSAQRIEAAMRNAAAKMGADAILILYDRSEVTGAIVTGPMYGPRTVQQTVGRVVVGVAIKYSGDTGS